MKHVNIREYEDHATQYLSGHEALTIEHDGVPIGYYIPSRAGRRANAQQALDQLGETMQRILDKTGLTEDELVDLFVFTKPVPERPKPRPEPVSAGDHASRH
jgi:hypothetical protein